MNLERELKKQKLVFILGLSHTGSTLLDLTLGSHPRLIALGEIYQIIRPDFNRFENNDRCSCGRMQSQCVFWGPVGELLKKNKNADIQRRYELVFDTFQDIFGQDRILVDSSKLPEALRVVQSFQHFDLKVIYLIRDVRAWTISRLNARNRYPKYFESGRYLKNLVRFNFLKTDILKHIISVLEKRPAYYFLKKRFISYLKVSYEKLGLSPNQTLPKLFHYIDVQRNQIQNVAMVLFMITDGCFKTIG